MASRPGDSTYGQDEEKGVPKKLSKGIVLGPDGKPCRTCNDMASLMSLAGKKSKAGAVALVLPKDCPPDVEALGRSSWTLLHAITATYPTNPTPQLQSETKTFLSTFGKLYPCWVCAEDFQQWMTKNTPRVSSRAEFGIWMCEAHNEVNSKLGKGLFDCKNWEQRWKDGWKDGRCGFEI